MSQPGFIMHSRVNRHSLWGILTRLKIIFDHLWKRNQGLVERQLHTIHHCSWNPRCWPSSGRIKGYQRFYCTPRTWEELHPWQKLIYQNEEMRNGQTQNAHPASFAQGQNFPPIICKIWASYVTFLTPALAYPNTGLNTDKAKLKHRSRRVTSEATLIIQGLDFRTHTGANYEQTEEGCRCGPQSRVQARSQGTVTQSTLTVWKERQGSEGQGGVSQSLTTQLAGILQINRVPSQLPCGRIPEQLIAKVTEFSNMAIDMRISNETDNRFHDCRKKKALWNNALVLGSIVWQKSKTNSHLRPITKEQEDQTSL